MTTSDIASVAMLALQLGVLVWGAATIKASVGNVQSSVKEIKTTVIEMGKNLQELTIDVRLLQARDDE